MKIAPDLSDEDVADVARLAIELELDGIIATNTTIGREGLASDSARVEDIGAGGLSGAPLKERSLQVLRQLRELVPAEMAIISVGGVSDAKDVKQRLDAGADLVQGYTAFLYEDRSGPGTSTGNWRRCSRSSHQLAVPRYSQPS